MSLRDFTQSYIDAALWSSDDDDGNRLERLGQGRISDETMRQMKIDAARFYEALQTAWDDQYLGGGSARAQDAAAGTDFWLTRNGHGAGFWDGDWAEPAAQILAEAARAFGPFDLYVGDDGEIHGSPQMRWLRGRPARGWYNTTTGGGCTAVRRDLPGGHFVLLTDAAIDCQAPTPNTVEYVVGLYTEDEDQIDSDVVPADEAAVMRWLSAHGF